MSLFLNILNNQMHSLRYPAYAREWVRSFDYYRASCL